MTEKAGKAGDGFGRREATLGMLAILILSLILRLRHLEVLLPWFVYVDEVRTTQVALHLLGNLTIDPAHSYYPAAAFYVNAVGYLLWAGPGLAGELLARGAPAISAFFSSITPDQPSIIMVSRWVSLVFGLASIALFYFLCREFMSRRWSLGATLLLGLNSTHVSMSALAKIDSINLFWIMCAYFTGVKYMFSERRRFLILSSVFSGLALVTKNNYGPALTIGMMAVLVSLKSYSRLAPALYEVAAYPARFAIGIFSAERRRELFESRAADIWLVIVLAAASAFAASPYTFIRFSETLTSVGWLYRHAEIISTYHTDPRVWWLDRYYYLFSVVLPFVVGLPLFWTGVAGAFHHSRKHGVSNPYIMYSLVMFLYVFASQAGGPMGAAFVYYLFLNVVPLFILVATEWLSDVESNGGRIRPTAARLAMAALIVFSLFRVHAFRDMFYTSYDRLGPWLHENVAPDETVLMLSVHEPGAILDKARFKTAWPQDFTAGLIATTDPDYIVIDSWAVAGFRKVYRDLWVAPLVDSLSEPGSGYVTVQIVAPPYPNRAYYAWLDVEHDTSISVLKRSKPRTEKEPP